MKILVAGIGNIFFGDDGFGSAVATRLRDHPWPVRKREVEIEVVDFGIRGLDLAFALTSGIDAAILVDAAARGGPPGTLYVIEPLLDDAPPVLDNHAMDPMAVLRLAATLGAPPRYLRLVGCEPARLDIGGAVHVGLSNPVAAAIAPAVRVVSKLVVECTS